MDDQMVGFSGFRPESGPAEVSQEEVRETFRRRYTPRGLSTFWKGLLGGVVGMLATLIVAGICYTAYQDHRAIQSVVAYLNQVAAANAAQQRPQGAPAPQAAEQPK